MIFFTWFYPQCITWRQPNWQRNDLIVFDDPKALASANWNDIHLWLTWLWIYVPLIVAFALTMLIAYGVIPSLIITGRLPATANRLKIPLTGFAFLVLVAAVAMMTLSINQTLDVEKFWDRYLI